MGSFSPNACFDGTECNHAYNSDVGAGYSHPMHALMELDVTRHIILM